VADAEAAGASAEGSRRELPSLIRDGVSGRAEAPRGPAEEAGDVAAARLEEKDPGGRRRAGEDVEDDGELEGEER
jgi:hypothetical protein